MQKIIKKITNKKLWLFLVLVLATLILGSNLRGFSYATVPNPGENRDEYSFAWVGLSLIQEGYPIAWSGIPGYEKYDYQEINVDHLFEEGPDREPFPINKPWFDHPPLFGLVIGSYSYWKGVRDFSEAATFIIRRPMLWIGALTSILILVLGSLLYDKWVGLLAMLVYSVIPTIAISSRMVLAENGYVPLFLGSIILATYFFKNKKIGYWYFACFLAAIAVLFKLSAIGVGLSLALLGFYFGKKQRAKLIKLSVLAILVPIGLFMLYGAYYDWGTFLNVFLANSNRFYGAGAEVFFSAFNQTVITKAFNDGWMQFGWIALFVLSFTEWKRKRPGIMITIAVFSYFLIFLLFGSETYAGYRLPFYPFIAISIAWLVKKLFIKPNLFLYTMLLLLPLGTSVHKLVGVVGFQKFVPFLRISTLALVGLSLLSLNNNKKVLYLQRIFVFVLFAVLVWVSILTVRYYNIDTWYFAS